MRHEKRKSETAPAADGEKNALDESLRRLGNILASPWLAASYARTEPRLERARLCRAGLTRREAEAFLEALCERGLLDGGARPVVERLCRERGIAPAEAARLLLNGEGWPEEPGPAGEETEDGKEIQI